MLCIVPEASSGQLLSFLINAARNTQREFPGLIIWCSTYTGNRIASLRNHILLRHGAHKLPLEYFHKFRYSKR